MKTRIILAIAASCLLSSCAGLVGLVETPYGSIAFDGKIVKVNPTPLIIPSK